MTKKDVRTIGGVLGSDRSNEFVQWMLDNNMTLSAAISVLVCTIQDERWADCYRLFETWYESRTPGDGEKPRD